MFAAKKLMSESLLNLRFRVTKVKYEELLIALENFIIDSVSTAPTTRQKKVDTSCPMEIEKATKETGESCRGTQLAQGGKDADRGKGKGKERRQKTRRKAARVIAEHVGFCGKAVRIAALCPRSEQRNFYAIEEEEHEINEEALHNDEELQEQRLLDLGEHEQWQEVISRREKPLMPHYRAWEATQTRARRKHRGENVS